MTLLKRGWKTKVGALNLNDALDLSASVARQNNFGGLWNAFAIRGFYGDLNLPSGFLVNGFNAGRGFGGPRDLIGIESVEVLKGPRPNSAERLVATATQPATASLWPISPRYVVKRTA